MCDLTYNESDFTWSSVVHTYQTGWDENELNLFLEEIILRLEQALHDCT